MSEAPLLVVIDVATLVTAQAFSSPSYRSWPHPPAASTNRSADAVAVTLAPPSVGAGAQSGHPRKYVHHAAGRVGVASRRGDGLRRCSAGSGRRFRRRRVRRQPAFPLWLGRGPLDGRRSAANPLDVRGCSSDRQEQTAVGTRRVGRLLDHGSDRVRLACPHHLRVTPRKRRSRRRWWPAACVPLSLSL